MLKSAESAGYMLTVACEGGIVVTERDGHAIARISPGATFGECLGCGLELIWMNFVSFFLQTKTDIDIYIYLYLDILDIRLAMLGVSPVCNSDWYPCHNATLLDNLVAKTRRNGPSPFEL